MEEQRKTLVMGASENQDRYSYQAVKKLKQKGFAVIAFGNKPGIIGDESIITEFPFNQNVDTVTLYLNPSLQQQYIEDILLLHPRRIIFNPGTENKSFLEIANSKGIETIEACTLVMLSTGQY